MDRLAALQTFLDRTLGAGPRRLSDPIGDASARRYWRVTLEDGSTRIVMDAPPGQVDCAPFVALSARLAAVLRVPALLAEDRAAGFLLLSDLGERDLSASVSPKAPEHAQAPYRAALSALVALQTQVPSDGLPVYDAEALGTDLDRFPEWYVARHLGHTFTTGQAAVWQRMRALLVAQMATQPRVLVHFDYHSRNLIPNPAAADPFAADAIGVLDFQDARQGPITYDLASLLKDLYIVWPEEFRLDLAIRYWQAARTAGLPVDENFDDFYRAFEFAGVYRHLRTLGTFARLAHREGKTRYLDDMPVALAYLREACARYTALHPLYKLLNQLTGETVQVGYTF